MKSEQASGESLALTDDEQKGLKYYNYVGNYQKAARLARVSDKRMKEIIEQDDGKMQVSQEWYYLECLEKLAKVDKEVAIGMIRVINPLIGYAEKDGTKSIQHVNGAE